MTVDIAPCIHKAPPTASMPEHKSSHSIHCVTDSREATPQFLAYTNTCAGNRRYALKGPGGELLGAMGGMSWTATGSSCLYSQGAANLPWLRQIFRTGHNEVEVFDAFNHVASRTMIMANPPSTSSASDTQVHRQYDMVAYTITRSLHL